MSEIRPTHYTDLNPEPIAVIEAWGLGFCLGSALKYLARSGRKPGADAATDLLKAAYYITREAERLKAETP